MKASAMLAVACAGLFAGGVHAQNAQANDSQVVNTVSAFLSSFGQASPDALHKLACPAFYAFDAGQRFSGDDLFALVKKFQAAGTSFTWSVTGAEVHNDGHSAWITYINQGTMKNASGTKSMQWLESAQLEQTGNGWCVRFLHSTPVAAK